MLDKRTQTGQYNTKTASITGFKIDKAGPSASVSFAKADKTAYTPGNWSNQNIVQTLSGNDNGGSGVSYYQYSENSGTATNTASGESWSADRNSKVKFRAVDAVGNAGAWTIEYNLMIDKTPPSVTSVSGTFNKWVTALTIGLAGSDNLSGIKTYQYLITSGGVWTNCGASLPCSAGDYKIVFRCIDNAGNVSGEVGAYNVLVDNIGPYIAKYTRATEKAVNGAYEQYLDGNCADNLSGVKDMNWSGIFISTSASAAGLKHTWGFDTWDRLGNSFQLTKRYGKKDPYSTKYSAARGWVTDNAGNKTTYTKSNAKWIKYR